VYSLQNFVVSKAVNSPNELTDLVLGTVPIRFADVALLWQALCPVVPLSAAAHAAPPALLAVIRYTENENSAKKFVALQ
jgi:hypothetical protein